MSASINWIAWKTNKWKILVEIRTENRMSLNATFSWLKTINRKYKVKTVLAWFQCLISCARSESKFEKKSRVSDSLFFFLSLRNSLIAYHSRSSRYVAWFLSLPFGSESVTSGLKNCWHWSQHACAFQFISSVSSLASPRFNAFHFSLSVLYFLFRIDRSNIVEPIFSLSLLFTTHVRFWIMLAWKRSALIFRRFYHIGWSVCVCLCM